MLCPNKIETPADIADELIRRRLRVAHLVYTEDTLPGLRRVRKGRGFAYSLTDGTALARGEHRQWIEHLAIPPAWRGVWICPIQNGHLQATGYDDRGRKQYRYHPDWSEYANADKFDELPAFGELLPRIRSHIRRDLNAPKLDRQRILAAIVRLIDRTAVRVGSSRYTKENHSYGATTLHGRHLLLAGAHVELAYRGKSGCKRTVALNDRSLAKVLAGIKDLPGQRLFQWLDETGTAHPIDATDVNDYLRGLAQADVTAKEFRTWHGSVMALAAMLQEDAPEHPKKRQLHAVRIAASHLGNTQATARKYYIHPKILALAESPEKIAYLRSTIESRRDLKRDEVRLIRLLES